MCQKVQLKPTKKDICKKILTSLVIYILIALVAYLFYSDYLFHSLFPQYQDSTKSVFFCLFILIISVSQFLLTMGQYSTKIDYNNLSTMILIIFSTIALLYDSINNKDLEFGGNLIILLIVTSLWFILIAKMLFELPTEEHILCDRKIL